MSTFDAYHRWLGIPPDQQPPDHYRLLGVERFESDPAVIESAADRQMAYVKTHATGQHLEQSQKLLNEISAANVCLLNPQKKAEYDGELKREQQRRREADEAIQPTAARTVRRLSENLSPQSPAARQELTDFSLPQPVSSSFQPAFRTDATGAPQRNGRRRKLSLPSIIISASVAGLLLLIVIIWTFSSGETPKENERDPDLEEVVEKPAKKIDPLPPPTVSRDFLQEADSALQKKDVPTAIQLLNEFLEHADAPEKVKAQELLDAISRVTSDKFCLLQLARLDETQLTDLEQGKSQMRSSLAILSGILADRLLKNIPEARRRLALKTGKVKTPIPGVKAPVPNAVAQEKSETTVGELYGEQLSAADTAERQFALARKLIEAAKRTDDDPATRYVLLAHAHRLAVMANDVDVAWQVLKAMDQSYQIDLLARRVSTYAAVGEKIKGQRAVDVLVENGLKLVEKAVEAERYDLAEDAVNTAYKLALSTRDLEIRKRVLPVRRNVEALQKEFAPVKEALAKLKQDPNDQEANLTVGKHLCFVKRDWQRGLPLLSRGSDVELKTLAKLEFEKPPADAVSQLRLADAWWTLGKKKKAKVGKNILLHAGEWYEKALLETTEEIAKTRIKQHLDELAVLAKAKSEPQPKSNPKPPLPKLRTAARYLAVAQRVIKAGGRVQVRIIGGSFTLKNCKSIEELPKDPFELYSVTYSREFDNVLDFSFLSGLKSLREINLPYTKATDAAVATLTDLPELTSLSVSGSNKITDATLEYVRQFPRLMYLRLNGTSITDRGLIHVKKLSELRELALHKTKITDAAMTHLTSLPKLVKINLLDTQVGDEGMESLAKIRTLAEVNLYRTKVTGKGLAHLVKLPQLSNLRLEETKITEADLALLPAAKYLRSLSLPNFPIGNAGLKSLSQVRSLTLLHFHRDNGVTPEQAKMLQAALPKCRIYGVRDYKSPQR